MKILNSIIVEILRQKGVQYLYHANTVLTSCSFLEHGGLISREAVRSHGLAQTSQLSDKIDVIIDVFDDIFLILWIFMNEVAA